MNKQLELNDNIDIMKLGMDYLNKYNYPPNTIINYKSEWNRFLKTFKINNVQDILDVSLNEYEDFISPYSYRTQKTKRDTLQTLLTVLMRESFSLRDYQSIKSWSERIKVIKLKKPEYKSTVVDVDEVLSTYKTIKQGGFNTKQARRSQLIERDTLIISIMLFNAFRRDEVTNLNIDDIDIINKTIVKRDKKGGKTITMAIGSEVIDNYKKYIHSDFFQLKLEQYNNSNNTEVMPLLFSTKSNARLNNNTISQLLKKYKIDTFLTHVFKKANATIVASHLSPEEASHLLGHRRTSTTETYYINKDVLAKTNEVTNTVNIANDLILSHL